MGTGKHPGICSDHERHIPFLAMLEAEGVVEQDATSNRWSLVAHSH